MLLHLVWHTHALWHGIHCYALLFCLGMLSGACVVWHGFRKHQLPQRDYNQLVPLAIVGILVGARLTHCLCYEWGYYANHLGEILLPITHTDNGWQFTGYQGLASHGGTFGLMVAIWLFAWRKHINWIVLFDFFAIATPLAGCFIRLGNFCNSEILGLPSSLPWAVLFADVDPLPRHPVQLYEAAAYLLIFTVNALIWHHRRAGNGFFLGLNLVMVCVVRLAVEHLKMEQADFTPALLTMGQWLTLPFLLFGVGILLWARKKRA